MMRTLLVATCTLLAAVSHGKSDALSDRQAGIVSVAAFTASGEIPKLKVASNEALDAGLTINEIKEVLVQMYAYAGFPRSLNGIKAFNEVVKHRQALGKKDKAGPEPSPLPTQKSSLELGGEIRTRLTGRTAVADYAKFVPVIDEFLRAHLFGDIFGRDNLDYQSREIATIAALAMLEGVEPQLKSHFNVGLNVGLTEAQLKHLVKVIDSKIDPKKAANAERVLADTLRTRSVQSASAEDAQASSPVSSSVDSANTQDKIIDLSREKWRWMAERNIEALAALFDDKAMFVHMSRTMNKEQELEVIKSGDIQYKHAEIQETSVQLVGDSTAILLSRLRLDAVVRGNEVSDPFVVTEVYVQQGGQWQLGSLSFTRLVTPQ
jgi:alkylhydroperoxidase/carboxymuconolactone decarboxylase family protein YurZ